MVKRINYLIVTTCNLLLACFLILSCGKPLNGDDSNRTNLNTNFATAIDAPSVVTIDPSTELVNGGTYYVDGANFGIKEQGPPLKWDNFEVNVNPEDDYDNDPVEGWDWWIDDDDQYPRYSDDDMWTGELAGKLSYLNRQAHCGISIEFAFIR